MGFSTFYQNGGGFMHLITLLCLGAAGIMLMRAKAVVSAFRHPREASYIGEPPDVLSPALIAAAVLAGVVGAAFGFMEACVAIRTIAPDAYFAAASRAGEILVIPLSWAALCAVPLTIAHGVLRHFESRLRAIATQRNSPST